MQWKILKFILLGGGFMLDRKYQITTTGIFMQKKVFPLGTYNTSRKIAEKGTLRLK